MPTSPTALATASLAIWRLTHLLVAEDGPFDSVARLRATLGQSQVGRAMDCFYCTSLWVALPAALILTHGPARICLLWLALSGAAALLEQATNPSLSHQENIP